MSHKAKDHKCKYTQVRNKNIETYLHLNILEIRPHRRCWGVIVRMALVKGYRFTWGGWQGKTRTMWRGAFFAQIYPTLRKN